MIGLAHVSGLSKKLEVIPFDPPQTSWLCCARSAVYIFIAKVGDARIHRKHYSRLDPTPA